MAYEFRVSGRIAKPVHEVFEAVVDPGQLSGYFSTGGAQGRLETGATVTWDFHDFPGAFPVHVVEVQQDRKVVLRWDAADGKDEGGLYQTTVTMSFESLDDGRTLVSIAEEGFRESAAGKRRPSAIARVGPACCARSRSISSTASICAKASTSSAADIAPPGR